MPDNYFEEVPNQVQRKSIRQIPIPASRRKRRSAEPVQNYEDDNSEPQVQESEPIASEREPVKVRRVAPADTRPQPYEDESEEMAPAPEQRRVREGHFEAIGRRKKSSKKPVWIVVLLLIVGAAVWGIGAIFSGARLDITSKTMVVDLSNAGEFVITENADYKVHSFNITASESVMATEEKEVERKASGIITIYNDFDSNPQELVATTRFRTESGLVFRIADPVVIPGNTSSGTDTKPGSVQATVYADKAGDEYNIGPSKFNIPGFEGSPKYQAFWAQSTAPMTGGFVGKVNTVSDKVVSEVESRLRDTINAQVTDKAKSEVGDEGFVLPIDPEISFAKPVVQESNNQAIISVTATVSVIIMDEARLGAILAKEEGKEGVVDIQNKDELKLEVSDVENNQRTLKGTGNANLVWKINKQEVQEAVAGKNKADAIPLIQTMPGVDRFSVKISPIWKRTFPVEPGDIEVVIK